MTVTDPNRLARSGSAPFAPRAKLLRMIGAELISDDVVAMTELVKNAHDADASHVSIGFVDVADGEGTIVITDDGDGMDLDTLLGRWMQPAGSSKGREGIRRTAGGRRYLGEKGMGRFAVDKLAARLELISRTRGSATEIVASFDWDEFADDDRMLSDVECAWEVREASAIESHGTVLVLSGLRSRWTERTFRRMCNRLTRLLSPVDATEGFRIIVDSDDFPDYSGTLKVDYLDQSPYRIEASFDGMSTVEFKVGDHEPVSMPWNGRNDLRCGPVNVRLHAFDLETSALAQLGSRIDVRAWLRDWSGISLYRDAFRVWPYGEPHDDWLRLDQRRVNNPVVRLSNNQIVGFVRISQDGNPDLRDQTNREGLINNRALEDLRRLLYFVLEQLEAERQRIRHPRGLEDEIEGAGKRSGPVDSPGIERLTRLLEKAPAGVRKELKSAIVQLRDERNTSMAERKQDETHLVELAVAGHVVPSHLDPIVDMAEALRGRVSEEMDAPDTPASTRRLHREFDRDLQALRERLDSLRPATAQTGRRRRTITVDRELEAYASRTLPLLDAHGVSLVLKSSGEGALRAEFRPEALGRILQVLVMNAVEWVADIHNPRVTIACKAAGDHCLITVTDNGPGFPAGVEEKIFAPRVTYREGAQGMGLTLARSLAEQHGGSIRAIVDRRTGGKFELRLPRKKARAANRKA